jgi:hypothetical protein
VKIETLEELTACDPATRAVFPFQGDILPLIQQMVAGLDLCDAVPEGVTAHYERSRKLFVRGYFDYELFTMAGEYALITAEMALRERLVEKIPEMKDWLYGQAALANLMDKAQKEGLIDDTDRELDLAPIRRLRNHVLHGKESMTITPAMAQPVIRAVSELINHLWRP